MAGTVDQEVTVTSLQVVHAALRRRKPLIVIDVSADAAIARALTAACRATGIPLRHERAGTDLGPVISERSAVLLRVASPQLAARACADLADLAAALRRIGVDGDALIWVTGGERLPAAGGGRAHQRRSYRRAGRPDRHGVAGGRAGPGRAGRGQGSSTGSPTRPWRRSSPPRPAASAASRAAGGGAERPGAQRGIRPRRR